MNRLFAVLIAVCLVLPGVTVFAAEEQTIPEYNAAVRAKADGMEEKYGIVIQYTEGSETRRSSIGTGTLYTLDNCFAGVTPAAIRVLSDWYRERVGSPLTISFSNSFQRDHSAEAGMIPLAGFTYQQALIEINVPRPGTDGWTGAGPVSIVHELGHAFFSYFEYRYGKTDLASDWKPLNRGVSYGGFREIDRTVFTSPYASTDYEEDFADTFSYGFVCNKAGFSISKYMRTSGGENTALGDKIAFIRKLMKACFPDAEEALVNLDKCLTAPSQLKYGGMLLSGSPLEFIGFSAPVNALRNALNQLDLEAQSSEWIIEVGAWEVVTPDGEKYLVFPAGLKAEIR